jgi:hypothetical protein
LECNANNEKLNAHATGQTTWVEYMTGLCVAAFGITCNDVIPNIFTSVVSKEDAVKESKVFQKWVIDKPFDNDQDDCNNGKPNGDVNDSFVWTVTVQKGESERGNERVMFLAERKILQKKRNKQRLQPTTMKKKDLRQGNN